MGRKDLEIDQKKRINMARRNLMEAPEIRARCKWLGEDLTTENFHRLKARKLMQAYNTGIRVWKRMA